MACCIAKSSVWSVFLVFAFKAKEDCFDSTKMGDHSYNRRLLVNYSDDSSSFLRLVYSKKNLDSEIALLKELEYLKNEFANCKVISEKNDASNKAIGVLERLAESEEIIKDKKLRARFEVFLTKTLLFLEFDQADITEFIAGLNLNGKLRCGYLKAKGFYRFGCASILGLLFLIGYANDIFKLIVNIHFVITTPRKDRTFKDVFENLFSIICRKMRKSFCSSLDSC